MKVGTLFSKDEDHGNIVLKTKIDFSNIPWFYAIKGCPGICWKTPNILICLPYPTNHFLALCTEECVHGTCVEPDSCQCFKGWSGNTCNKCIKMPGCMNGDCIDTSNACFCHEGKVIDTKYYKYS